MSLINQVLNQLEQRGSHAAPDQTLIRAVPPRKDARRAGGILALLGLLLALLLATWLWSGRQDRPREMAASGSVKPMPQAVLAPPAAPAPVQPAGKLSFELSMLPLPDALRVRQEPAEKAAPLVPGVRAAETPPEKTETPLRAAPPVRQSALPLKKISPQQQADAEYRKGLQVRQAGRVPEALTAFEASLKTNERHQQARLALAALLLDNGQAGAAERVLTAGLALKPVDVTFAMALARMQVEREQLAQAVDTLHGYLAQADDNADYQAFYAALLQRQQRHKEALNHYQLALRLQPRNGLWLMGYAISLQALERKEDASLAYRQALATQTLSPELSGFVQQKLNQLGPAAPPKSSASP